MAAEGHETAEGRLYRNGELRKTFSMETKEDWRE
jgi:hypothetical protein